MKGLNLGCGTNPGEVFKFWDNLDIRPGQNVIVTDLSKPLNYKNNTVDYIYTCHFIEHLSEKDGYNLLCECFRVLKKGGVIHLLTPDLQTYVDIYTYFDNTPIDHKLYDIIQAKKLVFQTKQQWLNFALLGETALGGTELLNGMKYTNNHHKFIYDFDDINNKCTRIGFTKVIPLVAGESEHDIFLNIDKTHSANAQIVVEITK